MRKKTVSLLRHKPQINRVSAEQGAVFPSTGVAAKQDTYRGFQTGLSSRGKVLVCSVGLQLPLPNVCYFWSKTNLDIVCVRSWQTIASFDILIGVSVPIFSLC